MKTVLIETILVIFLKRKNKIACESVTVSINTIINNMPLNKLTRLRLHKLLQTIKRKYLQVYIKLTICKSRNGGSGNRMKGMMGMRGIREGMQRIRVRMQGIEVGMRGIMTLMPEIKAGNDGNQGGNAGNQGGNDGNQGGNDGN